MNEVLSEYENSLIQSLRQDSNDLKDCYTRFSFQAIAFASAVLGLIVGYQSTVPYIALASIAPIVLLITVARIGIYKYGSANRQYGYELHLFRTRKLPDSTGDGWKAEMREIGWEEAMRAWRIVQVTVFGELYETRKLLPMRLKKKYHQMMDGYKWFDIKALVEPEAEYHPGSYLGTINSILFFLATLSSAPLFILAYQLDRADGVFQWYWYILPVVALLVIVHAYVRELARRKILESELHSIHSCAIMWQAVVVAHYRALERSNRYKHYTKNLVIQANDLTKKISAIHDWVYDEKEKPRIAQ